MGPHWGRAEGRRPSLDLLARTLGFVRLRTKLTVLQVPKTSASEQGRGVGSPTLAAAKHS